MGRQEILARALRTAVRHSTPAAPAGEATAVTYRRGAETCPLAEAGKARGEAVLQDSEGVLTRAEVWSWLIAAADLVLAGASAEPQRHDRIEEVTPAGTFVYELLELGGEPCWRWSDPHQQYRRITTRLVSQP